MFLQFLNAVHNNNWIVKKPDYRNSRNRNVRHNIHHGNHSSNRGNSHAPIRNKGCGGDDASTMDSNDSTKDPNNAESPSLQKRKIPSLPMNRNKNPYKQDCNN